MNAMSKPSTPLMTMGVVSRYFTWTAMKTRLSTARTAAAATVSCGLALSAPGTMSPTAQTSSRTPNTAHASRGIAPKDRTSALTLSNMNTFMTPDAVYMNATSTWRVHSRMFIVRFLVPEVPTNMRAATEPGYAPLTRDDDAIPDV